MAYTRILPSGNIQGCYRVGRDIRSAGTFDEEHDAMTAALREEEKTNTAEDQDSSLPYGIWFDQWVSGRMIAESTLDLYRGIGKRHILPTWKEVELCEIKPQGAQRWMTALRHDGATPTLIRTVARLFKSTLRSAVDLEYIPRNPVAKLEFPSAPQPTERYLTPEEVDTIAFHMPTDTDKLLVETLSQTGLRFGEMAGTHRANIDRVRNVVRVVEQYDQHTHVIKQLKDAENRTVPVPPELMSKLVAYMDEHPAAAICGLKHENGRCRGALLFRGPHGGALTSGRWGARVWHPALILAEIEGEARVHDLRHTYASWLVQQGVSIPEVALMLGHSSWEQTKRYAHLDDQSYVNARNAIVRRRAAAQRAS